jgi:hypothetical protein
MHRTQQVIDAKYSGHRYSNGVSDVDLMNGNIPGSAIAAALTNPNNGLSQEQRARLQYAQQRHADTIRNGYGADFDTSRVNLNGLGLDPSNMMDALTKTPGELENERATLQNTQTSDADRLKNLHLTPQQAAQANTPDGYAQLQREHGQLGLTPDQAQRLQQLNSYAAQQQQPQ